MSTLFDQDGNALGTFEHISYGPWGLNIGRLYDVKTDNGAPPEGTILNDRWRFAEAEHKNGQTHWYVMAIKNNQGLDRQLPAEVMRELKRG